MIEGLPGDGAAYVLKLHHSTTDGKGFVQLLEAVLSHSRETDPRRLPQPSNLRHSAKSIGEPINDTARTHFGFATQAQRSMTASKVSLTNYLTSAVRVLGSGFAPGSLLFRQRSLAWRFDTLEFPLEAFKRVGKAVNASVNDLLLAGLMGGFRRYHDEMGVPPGRMPISFPISLRSAGDSPGGNRFTGAHYAAPLGLDHPLDRLRHVQSFVRRLRDEPGLDVMLRMMPLLNRLPTPALTALFLELTSAQDAQVSNIPGLARAAYMAGAEVTDIYTFGPLPGTALMITMLSHHGRCCIGINSDRAAVIDSELLVECLRAGLDELLDHPYHA